jgi:hypothetical protein
MRRIALVILSVLALLLVSTGAGARPNARGGPGRHVEQRIFIDYAKGAAGKPSADASATDFRLLSGHPSWSTPTTVQYSVDTAGCSPDLRERGERGGQRVQRMGVLRDHLHPIGAR